MGITNKYEIDTTNYGTSGWNALLATGMEKVDNYLHTYLRFQVASGESIDANKGVRVVSGEWKAAKADGVNQPAHAIAIEAGVSGEYLRAQCMGLMSASGEWNFTGTGEVYLSALGAITQTPPANVQIMGYVASPNSILISALAGGTSSSTSVAEISYQAQALTSGETELTVRSYMLETVALTASHSIGVTDISGGVQGMIKVFAFDDSNFTFKYNPSKIILQGLVDASFSNGDLLIMLNRGSYWREIWRSLYT
jgi:hypothetical protein